MLRIFADTFKNLITSSAVILKSTTDNNRLSNLSGGSVYSAGVIIGRDDNADAMSSGLDMDSAQPAMSKANYDIDVVLPTILIAILFLGNAVIVYIIFQYRKRKVPSMNYSEELTLRTSPDVPQV